METRALKLEGMKVGLGEAVADMHWDADSEAAGYGLIQFSAAGVTASTFVYNRDGFRTHRSVYPDRASFWLIVDALGAAVAADMLASLYNEGDDSEDPDHKAARLELTAALRSLFPGPVPASPAAPVVAQ